MKEAASPTLPEKLPVFTYFSPSNVNAAGYYSATQLQALHPAIPLISRNPNTGNFTLTMDWKKSTDLTNFFDFPAPPGSSVSINLSGGIDFEFTSPDNGAFFRIEVK